MYARRFPSIAFATILLIPTVVAAADRWPCIRVGEGEAERRIHAALDNKTDVDFVDTPISEVMAYLAELHDIPILLDSKALSDAGLSGDAPVTANYQQISLRSVLNLMLAVQDLDYVIRDEVLQITTRNVASTVTPIALFDVSQMVPNSGDMDLLLSAVQSHANRYSVQVTSYHNVLVVKGNQQQQDEIGAFLAALFQAQAQQGSVGSAASSP